jgi:hypothetical protein
MWPFTWRGKNTRFTPKEEILRQMQERRPLPLGVKEFHEWSDRIISGACIPGATKESQKFALADMILHLGPTESHKEDAYFIHCMRKYAVNQVADDMRKKIRDEAKAELAKHEEQNKKIEIEKRYEDQIASWSHEDREAFIHARYLEESKNVVNLKDTSAATPKTPEKSQSGENNGAQPTQKTEPPNTSA